MSNFPANIKLICDVSDESLQKISTDITFRPGNWMWYVERRINNLPLKIEIRNNVSNPWVYMTHGCRDRQRCPEFIILKVNQSYI